MPSSHRRHIHRRYYLITVDGDRVCMNAWFDKSVKYWRFRTCPDCKLDMAFSSTAFRHLCENDGIMYSLSRAFDDYQHADPSTQKEFRLLAIWMSGKSLTLDHAMHIVESAIPHWKKAAKIIKAWSKGKKWDERMTQEMRDALCDDVKNRECWGEYNTWEHERFLKRKALRKSQRKNLVATS